jgi:hypothetical protein
MIIAYRAWGQLDPDGPSGLFLRAIFTGQSKKRPQAVSDYKKQVDYLVWAMLFLIGCGFVYSIGKLVLD